VADAAFFLQNGASFNTHTLMSEWAYAQTLLAAFVGEPQDELNADSNRFAI
jgi:hypothetical protein